MTTGDTGTAMQRLIDFVNTYDVENRVDSLNSPAALVTWLRDHDLLQDGTRAADADLAAARTLREGLRRALLAHDTHAPDNPPDDLPAVAVPLELRITADGDAVLGPAAGGVAAALSNLVAPIPAAQADGTWWRVKACPDDACQWAFIDRSRNRSRRWCSMQVCGNREKTRSFRERQRDD